ncbi:MAG: hypothetical protein P4L59_16970 [Desulfosporosinus sp.]|nr:hypothetical protein [Desulfosporosinus sp.]
MTKIPQRLIIDIEDTKRAFGFWIHHGDEKFDIVSAGKEIMSVPPNEQDYKVYKLLKEHCDVIFCTSQELGDLPFYPIPRFSIFAVDSKDNCFGTIGGSSNIVDDDYPVGYVSRKGMYGKIANSVREFLELVTFYPYWWDIVRYEQMGVSYDIDPQCFARQREIEETFKLSHNPKSIELLISNLKSPPEFMVYASKEEARKTNAFLDTFLKTFLEHRTTTEKNTINKKSNNKLWEKYKHKIVPGEKSTEELINFLKDKVDVVEIDTTEFSRFFMERHIINIVHCVRNQELKLTANDLNIIAFNIIKDNRSNSYYQCRPVQRIANKHKNDMIYVVFEKRTGYIHSNSNKLLLELFIERGISQYDYDNDTNLLHSYLFYLDSYSKGEY